MTAAEKRALAARLRALAEVPTEGGHGADRALLLRAQQLEYEADEQERNRR